MATDLCAFSWTLRDKLRTSKRRDDILELLLEESECGWVSVQRSRPIALLNRVRQVPPPHAPPLSLMGPLHLRLGRF